MLLQAMVPHRKLARITVMNSDYIRGVSRKELTGALLAQTRSTVLSFFVGPDKFDAFVRELQATPFNPRGARAYSNDDAHTLRVTDESDGFGTLAQPSFVLYINEIKE